MKFYVYEVSYFTTLLSLLNAVKNICVLFSYPGYQDHAAVYGVKSVPTV